MPRGGVRYSVKRGKGEAVSGRAFILCLESVTAEWKVTRSFILFHFNSLGNGGTDIITFPGFPIRCLDGEFCHS